MSGAQNAFVSYLTGGLPHRRKAWGMTPAVTRILVVDDDPGLVRMVKMSLEVEGFDVVTASDGRGGTAQFTFHFN